MPVESCRGLILGLCDQGERGNFRTCRRGVHGRMARKLLAGAGRRPGSNGLAHDKVQ